MNRKIKEYTEPILIHWDRITLIIYTWVVFLRVLLCHILKNVDFKLQVANLYFSTFPLLNFFLKKKYPKYFTPSSYFSIIQNSIFIINIQFTPTLYHSKLLNDLNLYSHRTHLSFT